MKNSTNAHMEVCRARFILNPIWIHFWPIDYRSIPQISPLFVSIYSCRRLNRICQRDERNATSALKGFGSSSCPGQAERSERGCRCISALSAAYKSLQKSSEDLALEVFPPRLPSSLQKKQATPPPSKLCLMCNVSLARISQDLNKSTAP